MHIITLNSQFSILNWNYSQLKLLAELAALTLCQFAAEALLYEIVKAVAQRFELNLVYHLVDEGEFQQQLCLLLAYLYMRGMDVHFPHGRQ